MLLKQEMEVNREENTVKLRNTIDTSAAASLAHDVSALGGGGVKTSDGCEIRPMGYIPPEMFNYDIHLRAALEAKQYGDMGAYTKYIRKFFEAHPEYAVVRSAKYYQGSSSGE